MSIIKHHTIIVTGFQEQKVFESHTKAIEIFERVFNKELLIESGSTIISPVLKGLVNNQYSFFIAPDGSKEFWETSDNGNAAREEFILWLEKDVTNYCDYVEVEFGGDDDSVKILNSRKN